MRSGDGEEATVELLPKVKALCEMLESEDLWDIFAITYEMLTRWTAGSIMLLGLKGFYNDDFGDNALVSRISMYGCNANMETLSYDNDCLCFKLTDDEGYRTQWQDMRMLDDIDGLKSRLLLLKNANEIRVKIREVQVGLNKEITV